MKKQIVVATVALALAAPVVIHAEATVYGRVVAGAVYTDTDKDIDGSWNLGATGHDGGGAPGSRFGFKGETDLGNGLTAGFKIERAINSEQTDGRYNYVYLSGGFGKITLGQQDNAFNSARNWDQTYYTGGAHSIVGSRTEGIQYSLSTGGFSFDIMAMGNDAQQDNGVTVATQAAPVGTDIENAVVGKNSVGSDSVDSWIVRAGYDFGVLALNVAHSTGNSDLDVTEARGGPDADAGDLAEQHRIGAGKVDTATGIDRSGTAIGINGSAGPVDWYLAYQTSELNADGYDNDVDSIGGFLGFRVSENDTLYAYYVSHSADRPEYDGDGDVTLGDSYTESVFGYARSIGPGVNFVAEYNSLDNDLPSGTDGDSPSTLVLAVRYSF